MLTSVVSVVYYARVVIMMYMHEPGGATQSLPVAPTTVAGLAITAFGTLCLGVFPGGVFRLAEQAVQFLFQGL
jgi:NADH-quinone oxidoreductase subunit N